MKNKKEIFIEKANKKHNNYYDYSKTEYINSYTKVCIICPEHGEFWQTPSGHLRGRGCPKCANKKRGLRTVTTENLIKRCNITHNDKYTYEKTNYVDANTKICITCPIHGDFYMLPFHHLNGQGCPKCSGRNYTQDEIIKQFREIHGNKYDYSKVVFVRKKDKVCITCPKHGEFWQTPNKHLLGRGCPKCYNEKRFLTRDEFVEKSISMHGDKYINEDLIYKGYKSKVKLTCPKHGEFWQLVVNHLQGCGCPKCANNNSKGEQTINQFLTEEIGIQTNIKDKTIIKPYELDIFIPSKNIAIEYDGLRWHSEIFEKEKNYHLKKSELCSEKGIHLIHIFEDEWLNKTDIVKSRLNAILGVTKNRIFARKCEVKEVSFAESKIFLDNNHIQGNCASRHRYGLYYKNELVSLMTFGLQRKPLGSKPEENTYELLRFCNKLNTIVVGGASRLFNHFIQKHNPNKIISYCDRRWSKGNMYEKLNFKFSHNSQPNYFYVIKQKRENRFKYRKSELVKQGFDKNKSEHEIMLERGIYRIYDCGTKVYEWKKGDF